MQWNKKTASLFAVLSLLLGGASAAGLQVHAQQNAITNPPAQIQSQSGATGEQENSAIDKDNIQDERDNGQSESALEKENGTETKDSVEANENLPGGGHQDQDGVNADHQFEGVE